MARLNMKAPNERTLPRDIAKKLRESETIAIVLPEFLTLEVAGVAAAFARALAAASKTVTVFGPALLPERIAGAWDETAGAGEPLREFIISFDLARSPIKELRYERAANRLNIILSPTGPRIARDEIEFRYGALRYDCAVALGLPSPDAAGASIARAPELLYEKFVIVIDADPRNSGYGDQNLVADRNAKETLPELVHAVLTELAAPLDDPLVAGPLLAALAHATNEFRIAETSANGFRIAGELARAEGVLPQAAQILAANRESIPEIQLAARAVARSRLDGNGRALWSLLTRDDFAKTGASPASLPRALARLRDAFRSPPYVIAITEDPDTDLIAVQISPREPADITAALRDVAAAPEHGWMRLAESFPSVAAAEERIAALLARPRAVQ